MSASDSFTAHRKPADEIISSDDDVVDEPSSRRSRRSSARRSSCSRYRQEKESSSSPDESLEIESSSGSDEESIVRPTKNKKKAYIESDSDEEALYSLNEKPSAADKSSESSDDSEAGDITSKTAAETHSEEEEDSEDDVDGFCSRDAKESDRVYSSESTDDSEADETASGARSPQAEDVAEFTNSEYELHSFNPEAPPHTILPQTLSIGSEISKSTNDSTYGKPIEEAHPVSFSSPRKSVIPPRMSVNFNTSIVNKLSSTIINSNKELKEETDGSVVLSDSSPSVGSPITLLPVHGNTIEISSESDISSSTPSRASKNPSQGASKNLLQPKILPMLRPKEEQVKIVGDVKFVSQDYYDSQLKKMGDLKSELCTCENLINTLGPKLPDKGKRMSGRNERLKQEIEQLALYLTTLKVEEKAPKPNIKAEALKTGLNTPSWEELTKAANEILPTHTGKVGMANFNAQKALTIERLKDIHGSLETCPTEDVFADDPQYLKVPLMNHQKHALAWMQWREKQKPRGGILADDMGLGKTLTMISLVLAHNQRGEDEESEEEEDDDDASEKENSTSGWHQKGKRHYYYGGTLVVCPASLIRQWESEVENRVERRKLTVCVYHGNNREAKPRTLAKYDMVVTTYNLVGREYKTRSNLFAVKWERIILDEAHVIRNHKSQASVSACELKGKRRWTLTGTPIQNKEMDLYALLKFLRCSPFDDLAHWKKWIDNSAGGQQRLNTVMKSLMLRRTKQQLQEIGNLSLPEKSSELVEVVLDKDEMVVYQKVMLYSRELFAQYLHQRAERDNDLYYSSQGQRPTFQQSKHPNEAYLKMHQQFKRLDRRSDIKTHEILVLLLRLRQVCCHPGLIDAMLEDEDRTHSDNENVGHSQEIDLLEQLNKLKISEDGLSESLDASKEDAISKALSKVLLKSNPVFDFARLSSKMKKIIELVQNKIQNTSEKALIVSQWTSVLNILKGHLERKGISTVSLNGTVPIKFRNDIVNNFNNPNSDKKIMLLSLTAGGVGLNLVGANHLLLIDLHWNPQLEAQAQDRIYRVGQKKLVYIYKFICKETIEERIKALQEHKLAIAKGVLTGVKATAGSKLSIDDLKSLFGL